MKYNETKLKLKPVPEANLIKRAIKDFDWENKLSLIDINDQVILFNETIVNVMSNFIPNEAMTFDDSDPPSLLWKYIS